MLRQYNVSPYRVDERGRKTGTVDVGTIIYIQDSVRPLVNYSGRIVRRNPWIIEAWHNRDYRGRAMAGGHLATVRSLRDNRRQQVADWILRLCIDI
jgi:hypothetical protein